ncbi:hypothetical protein BJS_08731 [Bradyrhizobium japonicum SEMIA 5079]|nr:hypothetical protein BJS_08731 [Bradyrhizobium japonicum SEMIA 5079]
MHADPIQRPTNLRRRDANDGAPRRRLDPHGRFRLAPAEAAALPDLPGMEAGLCDHLIAEILRSSAKAPPNATDTIEALIVDQRGDITLQPAHDAVARAAHGEQGQAAARIACRQTCKTKRKAVAGQCDRAPTPDRLQAFAGHAAGAHPCTKGAARQRDVEVAAAAPFDRNVEQLAAGIVARLAEIADLAPHEIECECLQLAYFADIVMMEARLLEIADRMAPCVIRGGEHPFGEMAELLAQAAAFPIDVAPRHEALVQHLAPGMLLHAELDVGLVHGGLGHGQPVMADRHRLAGEPGPVGTRADRADAGLHHVGLGPAMRFREEQIFAAGLGGAEGAEPDVMVRIGEFEARFAAGQRLQLVECLEIRRHHQDDFVERFVGSLRRPAEPGQLPLPAVMFQRDDDGEQRRFTAVWCGHVLHVPL